MHIEVEFREFLESWSKWMKSQSKYFRLKSFENHLKWYRIRSNFVGIRHWKSIFFSRGRLVRRTFYGSHLYCPHVREKIAKSLPGSWGRLFTNEPLFFKSIFKAPGKSCHAPGIVLIGSALKYFPRTKTLLSDVKCVSLYRSKRGSKNPYWPI